MGRAGAIGFVVALALVSSGTKADRQWTRCEVARELALKRVPEEQIGDWLCIAEHGSAYNGSAANLRFKWFGGRGYYGLFQIADRYACARYGSICGLGSCDQLLDDELDDDIECMLRVHAAYTRELGDGFAAWPVHASACRDGQAVAAGPFAHCLDEEVVRVQAHFKRKRAKAKKTASLVAEAPPGKVYERCELARELRDRHRLPADQIASWVCIAYHESRLNTSAEGRLNADGSGDHGLFQISDLYWCSTDAHRPGKACGVTCDAMRDGDIADDVRCVRTIHDEHRRLSGDGFNAWTVYKPHCAGRAASFVHNCFDDGRLPTTASRPRPGIVAPTAPSGPALAKADPSPVPTGKVYDRCELANDLLHKFHFPREQVATWVCIAYHESRFNTSAEGRLNADGSGDHGLFQISDLYWCSPPGRGWACGVSCADLKDSDIADDVRCVRTIFDEHQRLSGDGFNAWSVYRPYCQADRAGEFTNGCFGDGGGGGGGVSLPRPAITAPTRPPSPDRRTGSAGKVFERCELAQLLHLRHGLPLDETATWVCIARYQSNFNASAIGHGADGVRYHGLFQLSDEFWCSPPGRGLACGIACDRLRDAELTDDLACMRQIRAEHQRLSGDGYNAWAVYQPHCKGQSAALLDGCFEEGDNALEPAPPPATTRRPAVPPPKNLPRGKVYQRCELAQELYYRHGLPFDQIATWVCIAHRESNYNVSAVGRLNADGSGDHGLFQISDLYWCSPPGRGWVCGLACSDLEDNDLADDVECMRTIHEEHTRLSGDGFNAWAVYRPYCQGRSAAYTDGCFPEESPTTHQPGTLPPATVRPTTIRPSSTARPGSASTTPFRPWSRATTKRPTAVTTNRFTTTTASFRRSTTTNSPLRLPSTTPASVPKSTTSLYDFYLNHFGRRPTITTAMPSYTFKPFASRQRTSAAPGPTLPPAPETARTITPEDAAPETTTGFTREFNRWFQSG